MIDAYDHFCDHDQRHDPDLLVGGVYAVQGIRDGRIELHIITDEIAYNLANGYTWHTTELFEPVFVRMQDITDEERRAAHQQAAADRASLWDIERRISIETDEYGRPHEVTEYL